jgi:hypothetical protein
MCNPGLQNTKLKITNKFNNKSIEAISHPLDSASFFLSAIRATDPTNRRSWAKSKPEKEYAMFKNLKHLAKTASNIVAISIAETSYRITQASEATESVTSKLEAKSEALLKSYQQNLADRRSGVKKAEVVKEAEVPTSVITVN